MKDAIQQIKTETLREMGTLHTPEQLQDLKVRVMGKKGSLTSLLKQMGSLSSEERPQMGQIINEVRVHGNRFLINAQLIDQYVFNTFKNCIS